MQSIIITPHDPEHIEELREFIGSVIDEADFAGADMPPSISMEDIDELKKLRTMCILLCACVESMSHVLKAEQIDVTDIEIVLNGEETVTTTPDIAVEVTKKLLGIKADSSSITMEKS